MFRTLPKVSLDLEAVLNVISIDLCCHLHLEPHETNIRMRMAYGTDAGVVGERTSVSIKERDLTCWLTFLVVESAPLKLIVRTPAMTHIKASLAFDKNISVVIGAGKTVTLLLWTYGKENHDALSEEFISDE